MGACAHDAAPPPSTPVRAAPVAPDVAQWVHSERMRGPKTSNRGTAMALFRVPRQGPSAGTTVVPGSCALGLRSFLPTPAPVTSTVFAVDAEGALLRHVAERWTAVAAREPLPPLELLLGFTAATSPLELLAKGPGFDDYWLLTVADAEVSSVDPVDPARLPQFADRSSFRRHYDTRQCLA
ncbi:MAG: hypothetical protein K0V04_42780, partial [Deltaproteobacteria bacterium]|nr:hypothetical protein [Deltaproteobacteria bacterium]